MWNKQGVITVKILIIVTCVITTFVLFYQHLYQAFDQNTQLRNDRFIVESVLAGYDTYLKTHYGLYGFTEYASQGAFVHKFVKASNDYTLTPLAPLSDVASLKKAITQLMALRMPVNYLDQLLSKLEVIKKSDNTKGAIDLKTVVESSLGTLQTLYDEQVKYAVKVNQLDDSRRAELVQASRQINQDWQSFKLTYHMLWTENSVLEQQMVENTTAYQSANSALQLLKNPSEWQMKDVMMKQQVMNDTIDLYALNREELRDYEKVGHEVLNRVDVIKDVLNDYVQMNQRLLVNVEALVKKAMNTSELIDDTVVTLNELDGVEEVLTYIQDTLKDYKVELEKDLLKEENQDNIIESHVESNIHLLKECMTQLSKPSFDQALDSETLITLSAFDLLSGYYSSFDTYDAERTIITDDEDQAYFDTYESENKKTYQTEMMGNTIPDNYTIGEDGEASFWSVTKLGDQLEHLYDGLMINEYIVSTFMAYSKTSISDVDYYDKYARAHFFTQGEVEYILMGHKNEAMNVSKTMAVIFGVRSVMNAIHVYTDQNKLMLSESIGWSIAGWTGFGAPIISNIIRGGWTIGESFIDMEHLIKGEGVPFYKVYPSQWTLDIGLINKQEKMPKVLSLIDFTYHDYLRLMLMTVKERVKLNRIKDLISLNLKTADRQWTLEHYYTGLRLQHVETETYLGQYYD